MLFSLKLQRDNRKNALAVDPAKGKTGEKAVFSSHCGDETTTNDNRAFFMRDSFVENLDEIRTAWRRQNISVP